MPDDNSKTVLVTSFLKKAGLEAQEADIADKAGQYNFRAYMDGVEDGTILSLEMRRARAKGEELPGYKALQVRKQVDARMNGALEDDDPWDSMPSDCNPD